LTVDPDRPEGALRALAAEKPPAEGAAQARARRERTLAHMRGLQARAAVRREIGASFRRRVLVAAALLIPSGALGASYLPWSKLVPAVHVEAPSPPGAPASSASRAKTRAGVERSTSTPATSEPAVSTEVAPPSTPSAEPPASNTARSVATPRPEAARSSGVTETSTLADENRLMQSALLAAREGQNGRALRLLTELQSRFPGSPLAQNAMVERFRALRRSGDRSGAEQQARRYLEEYPHGMASDEARQLTLASPDR